MRELIFKEVTKKRLIPGKYYLFEINYQERYWTKLIYYNFDDALGFDINEIESHFLSDIPSLTIWEEVD